MERVKREYRERTGVTKWTAKEENKIGVTMCCKINSCKFDLCFQNVYEFQRRGKKGTKYGFFTCLKNLVEKSKNIRRK